MALTQYGRNKLADYLRGTDFTGMASWWIGLGSAAGISGITELSGSGYARQEIASSLANWAGTQGYGTTLASSGTSHATSNNAEVDFGTAGAAWGTASHIGIFDAVTGGNCWFTIPVVTPVVINNGDPVSFAASSIQVVLGITGGLSNYFCNKIIDRVFRAQAYAPPTDWAIGLTTSTPTNSTAGVEPAVGSYARAAFTSNFTNLSSTVAPGDTAASTAGTTGIISNNVAITWPVPTASWSNVTHFQIFDGANYLLWHALDSAKTMSAGGLAPRFEIGEMEIELS